jgi:hypothetical protein
LFLWFFPIIYIIANNKNDIDTLTAIIGSHFTAGLSIYLFNVAAKYIPIYVSWLWLIFTVYIYYAFFCLFSKKLSTLIKNITPNVLKRIWP